MAAKIIKDPVHGYIKIRPEWFSDIIDTPQFQRLKYIEQGSFRVLYPGARHDRFIHSLGTYHVAQILADNFIRNVQTDLADDYKSLDKIGLEEIEKIKTTYLYAALLHDVGHAPFSHTTEKFYGLKVNPDNKDDSVVINQQLFDAIKDFTSNDIKNEFVKNFRTTSPAMHEIISATILVKDSGDFLGVKHKDQVDLELAARMVIGNTYVYDDIPVDAKPQIKFLQGIKNCFIRLLNSTTIDADKLDYISRDTMMSGYLNIPVDIDRLASSVTAISINGLLYPAFRKNAFNILDNVFNAKLAQAAWVIAHPVVMYYGALQEQCIREINPGKKSTYIQKVFSLEALGKEGVTYNKKCYKLLCDNDIEAELKKHYPSQPLIEEYYNRSKRRHPVWKSFYEFKYLFDNKQDDGSGCYECFKKLLDSLKSNGIFVLNDETAVKIEKTANDKVKRLLQLLKDFCKKHTKKLDFVLLDANMAFSPSFDGDKLYVLFSTLPPNEMGQYYTSYQFLKGKDSTKRKQYFYLYSFEKFDKKMLKDLRDMIFNEVNKIQENSRV